jgi:hypothetical protein
LHFMIIGHHVESFAFDKEYSRRRCPANPKQWGTGPKFGASVFS